MHFNICKVLTLFLVLIATASLSLAQQTTATFAGLVTDATSAVLPGADVQLINEGTSAALQQLTSETGEFIFNYIPVGTYTLKIALPGFKGYEGRSIPLSAAQNVRRTFVLQVGSVGENITIT